jgi:nucleoside-diphosphate-sugar epimerase
MPKVVILGANGQLARNTTPRFLRNPDVKLTLFLRDASRLQNPDAARVSIIEGDVLDRNALLAAMQRHDVVYANLAGKMEQQSRMIVEAMHATGIRRLIFISSMGIYGEVPGESYRNILDPYRDQPRSQSNLTFTTPSSGPAGFRANGKSAFS